MADNFRKRDNSHGTEQERFSDTKLGEVHEQLAREKHEPQEGYALGVTFIAVMLLITGLASFCVWYLPSRAGAIFVDESGKTVDNRFSGLTYEFSKPETVKVATGPKPLAAQIKDGEKLFVNNCATCHQAGGTGVPGAFPPLAGSPWVAGSPDRLVKIAHYGLAGEVEVLGQKYNGAMPNIAEGLSHQKLADLATYVRQAWGNKADPVTPEQVKAIREATGKRGGFTPAELLAAHPLEK